MNNTVNTTANNAVAINTAALTAIAALAQLDWEEIEVDEEGNLIFSNSEVSVMVFTDGCISVAGVVPAPYKTKRTVASIYLLTAPYPTEVGEYAGVYDGTTPRHLKAMEDALSVLQSVNVNAPAALKWVQAQGV